MKSGHKSKDMLHRNKTFTILDNDSGMLHRVSEEFNHEWRLSGETQGNRFLSHQIS